MPPRSPAVTVNDRLRGVKLILAIPIFLLAELLMGKSSLAKKVQASAPTILNVNLALAVLLVLIGGWLRFSTRELKEKYKSGNAPAASAQVQPAADYAAVGTRR